MTIRRVLLLCSAFVIIVAGFFLFQKLSEPTDTEVLQAEQEIYALLLARQRYAYNNVTDEIQLIEFTNSGEFQLGVPEDGAGILQGGLELKHLSGLERKTRLDFQKKNTASYPIKSYLPDSANVILIKPADGKQLYWWVSFSRIGFNQSMTQALVLVGDCRGESCYDSTAVSMYSTGTYWLLEKKDEEWIIKDGQDAWHIEAPSLIQRCYIQRSHPTQCDPPPGILPHYKTKNMSWTIAQLMLHLISRLFYDPLTVSNPAAFH